MTKFTLANTDSPVRKSTLSLLFLMLGLMFQMTVNAQTVADIGIFKMVNKTSPSEGDTVIYTISVSNSGTTDAKDIQVKDVLPAGLTFISVSATKSTYVLATSIWGADLRLDISKGQTSTLTLKAKVNIGTLGTSITNTSYIMGFNGSDPDHTDDTASIKINVIERQFSCFCNLQYPDNSNLPRSSVIFNESEVLRAFDPGQYSCDTAATSIKMWYNDEHALTLGVRRVIVKTASGTTTTDYPITPTPAVPTCVINPLVGTTIQSGDQTGNDPADRPLWPALYITDLTVNGQASRVGDWQQGGLGYEPSRVCGTWKGAVRTIDKTVTPNVVTVTPDADPAKNNWTGITDAPPNGFASLVNQGYGAEISWNISDLNLIPGHDYRLQFIVHDGDQNKVGGDVGQGCTNFKLDDKCPDITAVASPPSICQGDSSILSYTVNTGSGTATVVGWYKVFNPNGCRLGGSETSLGTGTTLTVFPTATTTYAVVVKNADGTCNDTSCVTVTIKPKPVLTLRSGPDCDASSTSYTISLNVVGGTAPYSVFSTAGIVSIAGNIITVSGIPSGSGTTVSAADASGCLCDAYVQLPYTCCPNITASASPPVICQGAGSTLSFTGTPGVTVVGWFNVFDPVNCSIGGSATTLGTGTTLSVTPTVTTTYAVVVRNANSTCNDTSCVTVTVNTKPVLTLNSGPICDNTATSYSISLNITNGTGPFTANTSAGTAVVVGRIVTISGIPSGSGATITVTDANGCISDPYNQAPHTCCPDVTASASPSEICQGQSSTLSFTGTSGVTVVGWFAATTANGCKATGPSLGTGTTLTVTPATTSTYVVVVRNANNTCNDTSNCVTITVHAKPVLVLASGPICDASQTTYTVTFNIGGTGPFTATATAGVAAVIGNVLTVSGIPSGFGTVVKVTDLFGCSSDPYNVNPHTCCPNVTASASPSSICQGDSSILSFTGTPGVTVIGWFANCTATGTNLGTGNTLVVKPTTTTSYVVVVRNANNTCNDTSNCVTVTVHARPVLTFAEGPICDATSATYSIFLNITGGTGPYTATTTAGTATVLGNSVSISGIPSGSGAIIKVTDAFGCTSDPYNQAPYTCCPEVTAQASPPEICQGQSSTLFFTGTPGVTVVGWFLAGNNCKPVGAALGVNPTLLVTPGATTTYVVVVRNANNTCNDTSNCVTVTVHPTYNNIPIDSTICQGETVTIGGNAYGQTGNYQIRLRTTYGCDSIINLHLTVNPVKRTDVDALICQGEQIVVGGQIFTTSVTDSIIILSTSLGCDSIITVNIQVIGRDTIITNREICQGDFVNIGGNLFGTTGTYYIPFVSGQCTGIVQLNLVVNPKTTSNINREICEGTQLVIDGHAYATTGTFTYIITNSKGCDSTVTLNLLVNPKKSTTIDTTICRGEIFTVGVLQFSQTGTYNILLATSKGCDSTITLNLIVQTAGDTTRVPQSICFGDSAVINGQVFKLPGIYYIPVLTGRCTNIIELTLTVRPTSTNTIETTICQGQSVVVGGQTFNTSGTFVVKVQNSVGCDSTITLYLTVEPGGVKSSLDTSICQGSSVTFAGQTFSTTGTYQIIFPSGVCRDTLLLNLTVNPSPTTIIDTTICEGSGINLGGNIFTLSGHYSIVLASASGCDSTVKLNLTVNPVKHTDIDAVLCFGETIVVGGQIFTGSVTDSIIVLSTSKGCDSIIKLNVQILHQDTIVTNRTICNGDVVNIGGQLFDQPGTYYIPFQNAQCTGIVKLILIVNEPNEESISRTICEGGIVVIEGHVFSIAGLYTILTTTSQGCDSAIFLNLTVTPTKHSRIDTTICRGQTVIIGGSSYGLAGSYDITLTSAAGCDSIVHLNLSILTAGDTALVTQAICAGDSIKVGGQTFNTAGTYYINTSAGNCADVTKLILSVKQPSAVTVNQSICEGGAVVIGNQTFTTSGTYKIFLQNAAGCDSVVTLVLNVSQGGGHSQLDTSICQGSSITFANQTFTQTGRYQIIFPSGDCRDTLLLILTVNPTYRDINVDSTICEGSSVTMGGNTYTLTGNYPIHLYTTKGCDSLINLRLTVNPVKHTDIDAVICQGQQVVVGGQVFTTSVTDSIIILNTSLGCDSIIKVNIQVLQTDTVLTERTICEGEFVNIGGTLFTQAGTYYVPFQNDQCTGIIKLVLTVNPKTRSTLDREICEGSIFVIGGYVFNASGNYTVTIPNAQGCDSIITLNLTVNPKVNSQVDSAICRGETVTIGTQIFSTTGSFDVLLQSSKGCDSTVHLNLIVLDNGDTTDVFQTICNGDSVVIGGQTFKTAGTYYIASPNGRCTNIIALHLTVDPVSKITIIKAICQGDAVVVGGQTFTTSGIYTVVLQNSVGCDSIITLNLDVSQGGVKSQLDTTICEGNSVSFAGQVFSTTGTYQIIFPSGVCRDTLLLNLTVVPTPVVTVERTICEGQTVVLGNNAYGLTGNYSATLTSSIGCDSIVHLNLIVNPVKRTDVDAVICSGDSIKVGGQIFTTSVTNTVIVIPTALGCDSIITINIQVLNQDTITTNRTICLGDFVDIGGTLFDQAGTYYVAFQNNQCTGVVKLILTVNEPNEASISRTICEGDVITVAGHVFSATGLYTIPTSTTQGCDSTIFLNLTVTPAATSRVDTSICQGEVITIGGQPFNLTGNYTIHLGSAAGCDSIISLNLTVLSPGDTSKVSQSICSGDQVIIGGQTFNQTGVYYIATPNGRCSDLIELTLTVNAATEFKTNQSICEGQAVVYGGQTFTTPGTHVVTIQNSNGCDSTIILTLSVSTGGGHTQLDTSICEGSSVTYGGQTFTQTGRYQIIFPAGDCRDTLLLNLVVNASPQFTEEIAACSNRPVSVSWHGQIYTQFGFYTIVVPNTTGCDSIYNLNLTPNITCPPQLLVDTIYDTIPVYLIDTVCVLSPGNGAEIEIISCSGAMNGTGTYGNWTLDTLNGCLFYTAGDTRGSNDTMCVSVCDTVQNSCVVTTIIITVTGIPPIAVNDTVRTAVNTPITIPVLANDTTLDSDPLALDPTDPIVTPPVHGTVVINPDGTILYTPDNGYTGIDSFQYQISDPDGADTAWVFITIENCEMLNAFSPNGDGLNETFFIPCIDINNPVFLAIYNRWGIEVYRNEDYDNSWDGTYKGSPIPDGTYYYVLKYRNTQGSDINQGAFIVVHR